MRESNHFSQGMFHKVFKRIRGLDGLRGIAVLAVVIYHADLGVLEGGFLGVDVFFVLSGFLITALLIQEGIATNRIDRADFYIRRIRRLLPALLLILAFCVIVSGLWVPDAAFAVKRDLPWALTFVLNWSYLFFEQSYFINIARPPVLQHLWSLAIEEQFYVVWPLVMILFLKFKTRLLTFRRLIFIFSVLGAIASTLWMRHLSMTNGYPIPNDPSRVYFGTDTHLMSLLIGCAAAALWRPERFAQKLNPDRSTGLTILGLGSLATIFFFFTKVGELTPWLYRGGFLGIAVATAIAIHIVSHPALSLGKILGNPILTWFGDRSYGIYLWHWPIFLFLRPGLDTTWPDFVTQIVRVCLVLISAELSYRFVEMPIRNGAIGRLTTKWKQSGIPRPTLKHSAATSGLSVLVIYALVAVINVPTPTLGNSTAFGGITAIDEDPSAAVGPLIKPITGKPTASAKPITELPKRGHPIVFGDSVVLGARFSLGATLGKLSIDAAVSRQPWEISQRIDLRRREKRLGSDVVIHMGTNGLVREQDLRPILSQLRDRRRVVLVNVSVPRVWMDGSNSTIAALAKQFPNVRIANWRTASKGHPGYFVQDGVHLTPVGGKVFAQTIRTALSAT